MADNKFRIEPKLKSSGGSSGSGVFSTIEKKLKLENYFEEGFPVQHLPKIIFVMVLGLLYISNTHYAEKTVRKINAMQAEVEDLRADYTTKKADLMYASKQSEVARKVGTYGLKETLKPPYKVVVKKREY
ncbi:MAG TPA: FtsL-like putative cell division protein [Cyclobacteriaceae bacterium]|nr:FtsL-like putative cell division protein [Cyclobacteriaceae bacterium]HRJ82920.1 FtsL-like putative cell division protein [Cyclobacteriaceae bacterium]